MNLFELFVKIGVDDQASGKLERLSSKLGSGLKAAAKVGAAAVTAVGSGIAALGTYAAKVGGDFEAQMSKVSAISGATGDDLQALEDKAKQLGIDTKFSATEAGKAFEYMAMAGWKTEQMLDGVAGIMDLAAASGEDLAMVSDIVTDAMTAFGMTADQSGHFADVLATAASNANTNVAMLGESFKYVAPVAGALGYSAEDTAVALGLMANSGIKAGQAGTALRAALSNMLSPSENVSIAMGKIGLLATDVAENFNGTTNNLGEYNAALLNNDGTQKSLAETMLILRESFSGLTEAQQAEYAATIFGREAMSGMLAIINASDEDFEKLTGAIDNANGAAASMAETMANNLQGQLTLLQSSTEGFGLALYEKLQGPLTEMVSWAVEGLNQMTEAFNEGGVDGVVSAAGNLLSQGISTVVERLPELVSLSVSIIESFVRGLSENKDTIIKGAVKVVTTLIDGIADLLPDVINLGIDIIFSIAKGLIFAIPDLVKNIPEIYLALVEGFQEGLTDIVEIGVDIVKCLWEGIKSMAGWIGKKVNGFFNGLFDGVKENEEIHSPSKKWAFIGKNDALGFGKGWEDGLDEVENQISSSMQLHVSDIDTPGIGALKEETREYTFNFVNEMDGEEFGRKVYKLFIRADKIRGESLVEVGT